MPRSVFVFTTVAALALAALVPHRWGAVPVAAALGDELPPGVFNCADPPAGAKQVTPGQPFTGTAASEVIIGTPEQDTINGGAGDDAICGLGGGDTLRGEAGNDFLIGGDGDDELNGGAGNDVLLGEGGDDVLLGGSGNDHLDGGEGTEDEGGDDCRGQGGTDTATDCETTSTVP